MGWCSIGAENQIDHANDQYGNKIPGGSHFTQQAKESVDGVLNNLEQEAEKCMGSLGGIFGGKSEPSVTFVAQLNTR